MVNKYNSRIGKQYAPTGMILNARDNNNLYGNLKQDPAGVMVRIIRQQISNYAREIKHWKAAVSEAEDVFRPRRRLLTELYRDIARDAFIRGVMWNKRILRIANKPWKITDARGEDNEDLMKLLDRSWFNRFIKYAMESVFHGHSLIYLSHWSPAKAEFTRCELVPRDHVIPNRQEWLINPFDNQGFDYTAAPFNRYMVGVGEDEELGLLDSAAPLFVLKKHSWANWDEFEEIFGVPIRIAKTASTDPKVRAEIQKWLSAMGSAPYGIFPEGTTMEIMQNKQTDAFDVFNQKRKAANDELEILILGLRDAAQEDGTYGKQKALNEMIAEVTEDDKRFIRDLVNDRLIPLLRMNGYPFTDQDHFTWDEVEWEDPKDKLAIYQGVHEMGYELDQDQLQDDLGVTIKGQREMPQLGAFGIPGAPGKEKPGKKKDKDDPDNRLKDPVAAWEKFHRETGRMYGLDNRQDDVR